MLERQEDIGFWKKRLGIRKRADKKKSIKFDFRFSKRRVRIEGCLGFLREPSTERVLTCETVLDEVFIVAHPPEHKFAKRSRVDLAELAEEPFVYFPRDCPYSL